MSHGNSWALVGHAHRERLSRHHAPAVQRPLTLHQPRQRVSLDAAKVVTAAANTAAGRGSRQGCTQRGNPTPDASLVWPQTPLSLLRTRTTVKPAKPPAHLMLHSSSASFSSFTVICPSWSLSSSAAGRGQCQVTARAVWNEAQRAQSTLHHAWLQITFSCLPLHCPCLPPNCCPARQPAGRLAGRPAQAAAH